MADTPEDLTIHTILQGPEDVDPPDPFHWNVAHDLMTKLGPERATVLGLSMVSEQLDHIAKKLS